MSVRDSRCVCAGSSLSEMPHTCTSLTSPISPRDAGRGTTGLPPNVRYIHFVFSNTIHHLFRADQCTRLFGKPNTAFRDRIQNIWNQITDLPPTQRKALVLLCRAQHVPGAGVISLLSKQTYLDPASLEHSNEFVGYWRIVRDHKDWIEHHVMSSLVLDMCRSAPVSPSEIALAKIKSWGKEISILEGTERSRSMNFRVWFDPLWHNEPFIPSVEPNPRMASFIHSILVRWRSQQTQKLQYPRISRKLASRSTIREWENIYGRGFVVAEEEGGVEFTQADMERSYHFDGIRLGGGCEIRQKWYRSGTAPRTYFAQGGTSFHLSKYIQGMANDLVNMMDTTNYVSRLNPTRIRLEEGSYLRIYDLSSFTSNHHEAKYFVDHLADFCQGYDMEVFDGQEGVISVDMGELIRDYNRMNQHPDYSLERVDQIYEDLESYHNIAGFLGVYGNLMFSTFVHGGSLLQLLESLDQGNVAGDDAHYACEPGMEDVGTRIIRANGVVEPSKEFDTREEGSVCLKRGIIQMEGTLFQKIMIIWPSFSILGSLFGYTPPHLPPEKKNRDEVKSMVGTELLRFLRTIFVAQISDGLNDVLTFLQSLYSEAGFPVQGSLPQYHHRGLLIPVLPSTPEEMLHESPIRHLVRIQYSGGVVLPRRLREVLDDDLQQPRILSIGSEWTGPSSGYLKYLEMLGYLQSEKTFSFYMDTEGFNLLVKEFEDPSPSVYVWSVLMAIPESLEIQ